MSDSFQRTKGQMSIVKSDPDSSITLGNKKASDPAILNQVKSRFLNGVASMPWR